MIALDAQCEGCGPPLIILGGGTTGAAAFAPHARQLAGEFRVIRLQSLNIERALSRKPLPRSYSIRLEAQCMRNAIERLVLTQPFDVIGHSQGALIALDFALDQPHAIRGLVLSEAPAFWVVPERERSANRELWHMPELIRRFQPSIEPTDDDLARFLRAFGEPNVVSPPKGDPTRPAWTARRRCLRGLSAVADHVDDVARLGRLDRRVLLVEGTDTAAFHRCINARLARQLPRVERIRLPGGHSAPLTSRSAFLRSVRSFLRCESDGERINRS